MKTRHAVFFALSALCLALSVLIVACSPFRKCPEVPLSTLQSGSYLQLVPMPSGYDGRVPRMTETKWTHTKHPYHTAPDMRMDVDRTKNIVKVMYKRDGVKIVETWAMGKVTK